MNNLDNCSKIKYLVSLESKINDRKINKTFKMLKYLYPDIKHKLNKLDKLKINSINDILILNNSNIKGVSLLIKTKIKLLKLLNSKNKLKSSKNPV